MKKYLIIFCTLSTLLMPLVAWSQPKMHYGRPLRMARKAQSSESKLIRLFSHDGTVRDFMTQDVDSITNSKGYQYIWTGGISDSMLIAEVDSIWYMKPTLTFSTPEIDFGKVSLGTTKFLKVNVVNTGNYPESFRFRTDGVFHAENMAENEEVLLQPGMSKSISIAYEPKELIRTEGFGIFESSAVNGGIHSLPLVGEGVATEEEEEDVELIANSDIGIEFPDDVDNDFASECKLVNAFGEYSVSQNANAKGKRVTIDGYTPPFQFMNTLWPQMNGVLNVIMHRNQPYMMQIHNPSCRDEQISISSTVMAIIMTSPMLATSDLEEYNNLTNTIKKLHEFDQLVKDVRKLYDADKNKCPDLSKINIGPVITALIKKMISNESLTMNGLSLGGIKRITEDKENDSIQFRVINDLRRSVHIYPSKVYTNRNNLSISKKQPITWTLSEFLEKLLAQKDIPVTEDDVETINDIKDAFKDIKGDFGINSEDVKMPFGLPFIMDVPNAEYWKIVEEAFKGDTEKAIYHNESDLYQVDVENADKLFIDIYGIGFRNSESLNDFEGEDFIRFFASLAYSIYKDVFIPVVDLGNGILEVNKSRGSDNYKYDLRYGKRKYPTWALIQKLAYNWQYGKPDNANSKELWENVKKKDAWAIVKQISLFLYDEILGSEDQESGNRETYFNLLYNIYKNVSGNQSISQKGRDKFKETCNNLTYLKKADFIGKCTDVAGKILDLVSTGYAYCITEPKTTFIVNRKANSEIEIKVPEKYDDTYAVYTKDGKVNLQWGHYAGDTFGNIFSFDIMCYVQYDRSAEDFLMVSNIDEASKDENNRYSATIDISTIPNIDRAVSVEYRIITRHKHNKEMIYDQTNVFPIYNIAPDNGGYVDLGLPSGTLWASYNMGAQQPTDDGNYYAWADPVGYKEGKSTFSWRNYRYCRGTSNSLTKYCTKSEYGDVDNRVVLEDGDDLAHLTNGFMSRIPSTTEWQELMDHCRWTYNTKENYVKVTGKNGNYIILPCSGCRDGVNLCDRKDSGYYWTSDLDQLSPDDAWFIYFGLDLKRQNMSYYRSIGRSVRPILHTLQTPEHTKAKASKIYRKSDGGYSFEQSISDGFVVRSMCRSSHETNINE